MLMCSRRSLQGTSSMISSSGGHTTAACVRACPSSHIPPIPAETPRLPAPNKGEAQTVFLCPDICLFSPLPQTSATHPCPTPNTSQHSDLAGAQNPEVPTLNRDPRDPSSEATSQLRTRRSQVRAPGISTKSTETSPPAAQGSSPPRQ